MLIEPTRLSGDVSQRADRSSSGVLTVKIWAWIGMMLLGFELYVLAVWIAGPHFAPTAPGADAMPPATHIAGIAAQGAALLLGAAFFYFFVLRRLRQEGGLDTTSFLVLSWSLMWFWDPMMNYTSPQLLYNSHLLNFGSWTLGSTPGWTSPNGNLLPEPLLIVIPGYPLLCLGSALATHWILQRSRFRTRVLQMILSALLILFVADTVIEVALIRTGLYVFPGGIRAITLFAGHAESFPLSEALLCSFGWTATFAVLTIKGADGLSFVENGAANLRRSPGARKVTRFLAIFGFTHLATLLLWVMPSQWLATHSGPYPDGLPSYLINHLCVYGVNQDQCPGPGVPIIRP